MKIGVVGVCASGKSTLIKQLTSAGFDARHIAQEHSYVPSMWRKITNPDILIYLHASYPVTIRRRNSNWFLEDWQEQIRRLQNAIDNADLTIETDELTPDQVFELVLEFLKGFEFKS